MRKYLKRYLLGINEEVAKTLQYDLIRRTFFVITLPASIGIIYFQWNNWFNYSPILLMTLLSSFLFVNIGFIVGLPEKYFVYLKITTSVLFITSILIVKLLKMRNPILTFLSIILPIILSLILANRKDILGLKKIVIPSLLKKIILFILFLLNLYFIYDIMTSSLLKYLQRNQLVIPIILSLTLVPLLSLVRVYEQEKIKERELLKKAQTQAKLSSLKDQLSPHFLFNTLNTITSISQEQTVKDFVDEVANIYRYVLQFKEVDSVTLRQEMEFIQSYLFIIKSRLEGGIDFDINIENENLLDSKMPPLTLQMLIENAVKHNTTSIDKPLSIKLFTTEDSMLVVQNVNQPKLSVLPGNETGLQNIAERYRLLYKKEIVVENKNGFFTVKLPIVLA